MVSRATLNNEDFIISRVQSSAKVAFSELRGGLGGTLSNLGYEIYGDKAALRGYGTMFQLSGHADEPVKVRLELDKFDGTTTNVPPCEIKNMYQCLIEHHAQSVLNGTPLTAEDALHNIQLCEAAHESAQNGGKLIEVK